jgi:hypothetical protein
MANFELITFNPTTQHRNIQQSNQLTIDFAKVTASSPPVNPNDLATKAYVDSVVTSGGVTSIVNGGTGTGMVLASLSGGVATLRNLKMGSGILFTIVGNDIIISATGGGSAAYFLDFITSQTGTIIPVGNTYNIGTYKLEPWRNGLRMFNSLSVGGPVDEYTEVNATNIQLVTAAVTSDWFGFLNYSASVSYSNLITGFSGTNLTVPAYTIGDDSFRIYRNGILLNHSALGSAVDQYSEMSTTSVTLGLAAVNSDVFLVESVPVPTWRQDISSVTGTTLTFSSPYTMGTGDLIGFRNGLLMTNSLSIGNSVDQYQEATTTTVTLQTAAQLSDVFTFIAN